jgi:hypothetical protein
LRRGEPDSLQVGRRRKVDRSTASSARAQLSTRPDRSFDKNITGTQSSRKPHLRNIQKQIETDSICVAWTNTKIEDCGPESPQENLATRPLADMRSAPTSRPRQ